MTANDSTMVKGVHWYICAPDMCVCWFYYVLIILNTTCKEPDNVYDVNNNVSIPLYKTIHCWFWKLPKPHFPSSTLVLTSCDAMLFPCLHVCLLWQCAQADLDLQCTETWVAASHVCDTSTKQTLLSCGATTKVVGAQFYLRKLFLVVWRWFWLQPELGKLSIQNWDNRLTHTHV